MGETNYCLVVMLKVKEVAICCHLQLSQLCFIKRLRASVLLKFTAVIGIYLKVASPAIIGQLNPLAWQSA